MRCQVWALLGDAHLVNWLHPYQEIARRTFEVVLAQIVGLVLIFARPGFQYVVLKRFSRKEGAPELSYLPEYGFRLVIRNLPGKYTLSDIKQRAFVRKIIAADQGSSVATLLDEVLVERGDLFLFPGTDQVLLCFRLEGPDADRVNFLVTDKLGKETKQLPLTAVSKVICDYSAMVNNPFNFNVRLQKRSELTTSSLISMWKSIQQDNEEQQFELDRIRDVG